jgi:hypothetical protein
MALLHNPSIVTSGLVFAADPANIKSYRENLLTYSENLITGWSSGTTTITNNVITAPNGTSSGSFMAEAADGDQHLTGQGIGSVVNGTTYTLSVYAKAGTRTQLGLTAFGEGYSVFNLSTGTVIQTGGNVCTITPVGNGWYRCTAAITKTNTDPSFYLLIWNNGNPYAGIAGYGIYIWGAQLNVGNAAAPYTPTTATAVAKTLNDTSGNSANTIIAGSPVFTGSGNINSITFPSTPATWFQSSPALSSSFVTVSAWVKVATHGQFNRFIHNNWVGNGWLLYSSDANWLFGVGVGNVTQYNSASPHSSSTAWTNLTGTYDGTNVRLYVNGIAATPVALSSATLTTTNIQIGTTSAPESGSKQIGNVQVYNRALSATEVAQNFAAHRSRYGV